MKPSKNKKVSRKELAATISEKRGEIVTVGMLRRNEKKWGLRSARGHDLNRRVVRYCFKKAMESLRLKKVI